MAIRVALRHVTEYKYDRPVQLGPQTIRLRPAPHCRTPVPSYALEVTPAQHFLNWQQDPHSNFLARVVFAEPTTEFRVAVQLTADLTVINPFDFFIESYAEEFPFEYEPALAKDLRPFLELSLGAVNSGDTDGAEAGGALGADGALGAGLPTPPPSEKTGEVRRPAPSAAAPAPDASRETSSKFEEYFQSLNFSRRRTIDFLVDVNQRLWRDIKYGIRLEPGVQSPEVTLTKRSGSCRDSAWLFVQLLRRAGLAARFVSGYLIQLAADVKSLDGPSGPEADFTDLHAWCEVFAPGAGWIGLDPTSGLFTGEGHLPLAATPDPTSAAPISGAVGTCETKFHVEMHVSRVFEDPRVTKPYSDEQWQQIDELGHLVDEHLERHDVRLTMGGEPTFVSIDDMEGDEWNTAAVGLDKQRMSVTLLHRLRHKFAPGALLHFGQGKWYPGESLPRWSYSCLWRTDGEPIWSNPELLADVSRTGSAHVDQAGEFLVELADRLGVEGTWIRPAYEDVWHTLEQEQKLPVDVDPRKFDLDADEDRRRLAKIIETGLSKPVGYALPLTKAWWQAQPRWTSGPWPFRSERLFLLPGDSPIGLRLPLDALPFADKDARTLYSIDPFAGRPPLPGYQEIRRRSQEAISSDMTPTSTIVEQSKPSHGPATPLEAPDESAERPKNLAPLKLVATALCVEPRGGRLHVFMPPVTRLEDYLELVGIVEAVAEQLHQPVVIEGYTPPIDSRLQVLKVTPDPGVIEVNVHPARNWNELKEITVGVYDEARLTRLGTEKFQLDGTHTGTGGGNHVVLGGPTTADSPFLRRPDLLSSFVSYWINHPSLSYIFSGRFIGPTSQAPRVDEGRRDALYELEIARAQLPDGPSPPWLVDRLFRNLLVDLTGNTHRAEFCIDKLYSPDSSSGRLGLVELRAFEMPPHARMSLAQQLLVRALVALFWEKPYREPLARWGTALHDRFLLPYFMSTDLNDVLEDLRRGGFEVRREWFDPHIEFRCPRIGEIVHAGISLELRAAIEPWYVLGEEAGAGGTARYVDSSVERMQVFVTGLNPSRHVVTCNQRTVPLQPTGRPGEFVAGVRYRAWQPPSCLHPTIPVHTPLTFDLIDVARRQSEGGCRYFVDHPGGLNRTDYPVNALEAECRRAARFSRFASTGGTIDLQPEPPNPDFPGTLDLRRSRRP